MKDAVDRVTDVLLEGYKTDAQEQLKSKVTRTELEDEIKRKFDHDRGKECEKLLRTAD